jgi:Glycosyl hydrolase family 3 N terminal domain/DUF218 domain
LHPSSTSRTPGNPAIGHYGRAFSGDADTVTAYASAFVRGFEASGVCCVLKHFPGQGGAQSDSHEWAPDFSAVWSPTDLLPFRRLVREDGVAAVMSGYSLLKTVASDNRPAALSREIVTGLLRSQLEFDGVAVTDDLDMGAVGYGFARRSAIMQALEAGNDGLMGRNRKNYDPAFNSKIEATEAIEMAALAGASGVPKADILVEPRAAHTDQNMSFSRELLEASIGVAALRSILLVTIHKASDNCGAAPFSVLNRDRVGLLSKQALFIVRLVSFPPRARERRVGTRQDRKILRRLDARRRGKRRMTLAIAHGESVEAPPYASLRDAVLGATARFPEGRFIHANGNAPHRTWTYQETLKKATDLAAGLRAIGRRSA